MSNLNFHSFPPQVFQAEKGDEKAYYESGVEWPDSETHPGSSLTGDPCRPKPPQTAMEGWPGTDTPGEVGQDP